MAAAAYRQATGQPEKKSGAIPKGARDAEKSWASLINCPLTMSRDILEVNVWGKNPLAPEGACIPTIKMPVASGGFPMPGTGPFEYPCIRIALGSI